MRDRTIRPDPWTDMGASLADIVPDMVCVCRDGQIEAVNRAGTHLLRAESEDDLVGQPFARFVHPDYAAIMDLGLASLTEEVGGVPVMLVGLDGQPREVHIRVKPLTSAEPTGDGPERVLLCGRDVTERTRAVDGLLASESRFRTLVEQAFTVICMVRDHHIVFMNAEGRRLLQAPSARAMNGRPFASILHPDYKAILELGLATLADESELLPLRMVATDGTTLDVEARVVPVGDARNDLLMVEARDITERKRVSQALREREQRLQGILDTVSEAIITTDNKGIIQTFNPAARDMFGYAATEAVGRNVSLLMPEPDAKRHDSYYRRMVDSMSPRVLGLTRELEGRRKDGSLFPIEISISHLNLGTGPLITGIIRDITERRRHEEAERRYKEDLESQVRERTREVRHLGRQTELILRSAGDGIVGLDVNCRLIFANPVAERLLRAPSDSLRGMSFRDVFRDATTGQPPQAISGIVDGEDREAHGEATFLALDGATIVAEFAAAPITDEGRRIGAVVVFRDVSARKEVEQRLRLAYTVFAAASEAIVVCDTNHIIDMINPAFTDITGHPEHDVVGTPVSPHIFDTPARFASMTASVLDENQEWADEFWHNRRDGTELALRVVASAVRDEHGVSHRYALVISDITQRKRDEERIHYQAKHDALTGLANRALFMETLAGRTDEARNDGGGLALMFIDLDGFKAVNDTLGHDAGDLLLKGAAHRIQRAARERDTVARLGGDEFTVILPGILARETAGAVARRVLNVVSAPYSLNGEMARISASIGVALLPADAEDAETLLRRADAAMYKAKQKGKAGVEFYQPGLDSRSDVTADSVPMPAR